MYSKYIGEIITASNYYYFLKKKKERKKERKKLVSRTSIQNFHQHPNKLM